jgi:hypothetical protein
MTGESPFPNSSPEVGQIVRIETSKHSMLCGTVTSVGRCKRRVGLEFIDAVIVFASFAYGTESVEAIIVLYPSLNQWSYCEQDDTARAIPASRTDFESLPDE